MSIQNKYTLYGALFGFLFPVFSTLLESWFKFESISFDFLVLIQSTNPLIWVINTAPFFLGIFARLAGVRQDSIQKMNLALNKTNQELKVEIAKSNSIETNLRDMIAVYKEDLHSAKIIQDFSLPEIPDFPNCNIIYKYLPLNPVGGDLLSLKKLDESHLSILVGDVVGHGISAALIASLVNVLASKSQKENGLSPQKYIEYLNKEANLYLPGDYYFTAMYGVLHFRKNSAELTFSRGGHPHPFVFSYREQNTTVYEIPGTPLGILDNLTYNELTIPLFPNDKIFIITDGFLEIRNANNNLLGMNGFSKIITDICKKNLSLEVSIENILSELKNYSGEIPLEDDRLILGIQIF